MNDNACRLIESVRRSWHRGIEPDLLSQLQDQSTDEQSRKSLPQLAAELIVEDLRARSSDSSIRQKNVAEYIRELSIIVDLSTSPYLVNLLATEWEIRHRAERSGNLFQLQEIQPAIAAELFERITHGEYFRSLPMPEREWLITPNAAESELDSAHDPHATTLSVHPQSREDHFETESPSSIDTLPVRSDPLAATASSQTPGLPTHLGRYRVERKLGAGAFGDLHRKLISLALKT